MRVASNIVAGALGDARRKVFRACTQLLPDLVFMYMRGVVSHQLLINLARCETRVTFEQSPDADGGANSQNSPATAVFFQA